jgi:hypothetical protein
VARLEPGAIGANQHNERWRIGTRCNRARVSTTSGGEIGTRCNRARVSTTSGGEIGTRCNRRESAQRAVARLEPGVIERESAQRAVARLEPGVIERESDRDEQRMRKHKGDVRIVLGQRKKLIDVVLDVKFQG